MDVFGTSFVGTLCTFLKKQIIHDKKIAVEKQIQELS
jgi:hypothetical protein